jgi:hypothetical protein
MQKFRDGLGKVLTVENKVTLRKNVMTTHIESDRDYCK